ncbi:hypothetical protein [Profundibacterium mesophilum]|uniref:Uncharacterized protein n=1 Tax=Profundibacterium mesophilum KAUST100406-0324 TaxID=1037889 RepID=A0A921NWI2_9RHOB|nr:hypothetical protein [Profundibacterium mesophilum]KAF0676750.1 hypothetical protein PMES_00836 [Profundibacterium mesophilum KAUST100406-0324]
MTQETNPEKNQPPRAADHAQPEKPRRKKKAPPIGFNALDDHEQKLVRSIAITGARVAGRQQKRTEGQLKAMKAMKAMKDTLEDIFANPDEADPRFIAVVFKGMLDYATSANAKKIASHALCPPDLARAYRPDA